MRSNQRPAPELANFTVSQLTALVEKRQFLSAANFFENHQLEIDDLNKIGSVEAAVVNHNAARAYASLSENKKALKFGRIAEAIATKCGDQLLLAELYLTLGGILRNLNELNAAHKAYQDAESLFRRQNLLDGQCRALNKIAGLYYHDKDFRNALSVLLDAVDIARELEDKKKLAYMMGNIGRIQLFTGDHHEAEKHLKINLKLSEELCDDLEVGRAQLSLGYLYIQREEYSSATESLDNASLRISLAGSVRDEAICLTYYGELCYRQGEYEKSRIAFDKALSLSEKISSDSSQIGTIHRHLAELNLRTESFKVARRHVSRGLKIMRSAGDLVELGALHKISALISAHNNNAEQGIRQMRKALDLLDQSGVRWEKADALVAAGQSQLFSRRQRMTYLFRAEEFYARARMTNLLGKVGRYIVALEKSEPSLDKMSTSHPLTDSSNSAIDFETTCPEIMRFKKQLPMIGNADLPILLTGETGVGKDHMARYFHSLMRPNERFVAINCASVPESLLESELFGYHKGAFTGAESNKQGLFVAANGGVLFLDEIGDMPLSLQTKLLGVLERRKVLPLGTTVESSIDILLVAATNCDLEQMVEDGKFRRDLYYRLSGVTFKIPPLRERKADIVLLVERFLRERGLIDAKSKVPSDLMRQFIDYDWPGNVRELDNRIRRLDVMSSLTTEGNIVELAISLFGDSALVEQGNKSLFERVEKFERELIIEAIMAAGGNKSKAARMLGIHEATVRTKVKRYGIIVEGDAPN